MKNPKRVFHFFIFCVTWVNLGMKDLTRLIIKKTSIERLDNAGSRALTPKAMLRATEWYRRDSGCESSLPVER